WKILNHHEDVEDVFQATFLALVCRAGKIRNRTLLGAWLRVVAHRLALRRRTDVASSPVPLGVVNCYATADGPEGGASRKELGQLLRAELDCLPKMYRFLVDQCYMKGKTNTKTAGL